MSRPTFSKRPEKVPFKSILTMKVTKGVWKKSTKSFQDIKIIISNSDYRDWYVWSAYVCTYIHIRLYNILPNVLTSESLKKKIITQGVAAHTAAIHNARNPVNTITKQYGWDILFSICSSIQFHICCKWVMLEFSQLPVVQASLLGSHTFKLWNLTGASCPLPIDRVFIWS